jgi:hypothetical protein
VDLDGSPDSKATFSAQEAICGGPVITDLMGGSPDEQRGRYHDASPIELLPLGVPQEFFAGRMFAAQAAPYDAATTRAGDELRTTLLPDAGHFVFIDPQSEVWPRVLSGVRHLLRP